MRNTAANCSKSEYAPLLNHSLVVRFPISDPSSSAYRTRLNFTGRELTSQNSARQQCLPEGTYCSEGFS